MRSSAGVTSTSAARCSRSTSSSYASRCGCASASPPRSPDTSRASPEAAAMRRLPGTAMAVATLAGCLTLAVVTWAQHAHDAGHAQGHQAAQACATEFEKVIGDGRGFGMAFAAEQNGYPGPMHVLELKERLGLTADQATKVRALLHAMFVESKPKSARLLEAEARLRRLFADVAADDASVRAAVADVERARSEVRLVHLLTHLKTRDLLTEAQRRIYQDARWGGR